MVEKCQRSVENAFSIRILLENLQKGLEKAKNKTPSDVHCILCNSDFNIGNGDKSDIEKHIKTTKHKNVLQAASKTHAVTNFFPSTADHKKSANEGVWAYHTIKANQSFASSDCASKLFRTCFELPKFHCARTKCEAIVVDVLAPHARDVLKNELSERRFVSVSTDASNHGNIKMMPVVVRYFIPTVGVRVKMLEFKSTKGETSEIIASLIKSTAEKNEISDKIVGFCGDNCPTNFGSCERGGQNNVFFRLKQWKPSIIGVGCAVHIVHNALKYACDHLPIDIECVVVKVYSEFYINTVRVEALKSLCDSIEGIQYSKLLGYAKTRFLALGPAIGSILNVFQPLKEYFLSSRRCPTIIRTFFESPCAKLWLLFIKDQVKSSKSKYLIYNVRISSICTFFVLCRLNTFTTLF